MVKGVARAGDEEAVWVVNSSDAAKSVDPFAAVDSYLEPSFTPQIIGASNGDDGNVAGVLEYYPPGQNPMDGLRPERGYAVLLQQPYLLTPPDENDIDSMLDVAIKRDFEEIIEGNGFLSAVAEFLSTVSEEEMANIPLKVSGLVERADALFADVKDSESLLEKERKNKIDAEVNARGDLQLFMGGEVPISDDAWEAQKEMYGIPGLEKKIDEREKELSEKREALKVQIQEVNLKYSAQLLNVGMNEDAILSHAGLVFAEYGFENEALGFFKDAQGIASKIGDEDSVLEQRLYQIKYDTSVKASEKIKRYNDIIKRVNSSRVNVFNVPPVDSKYIPISIDGSHMKEMKKARYEFLSALSSQALKEMVSLSIEEAKYDLSDEGLVTALAQLDDAIESARGSELVSAGEVEPLVAAASLAIEPFVREAEDEVRDADLEGRKEALQGFSERSDRVEGLYGHLLDVSPEAVDDPILSETYGNFGIERYFSANQRTGFAYEGLEEAFNHVVKNYPDSNTKAAFVKTVRYERPDLFDDEGNLLPSYERQYIYSPDGDEAAEELSKLNFVPGSIWESLGYDLAGSTVCSEVGFGVGGPVGGLVGLFFGIFGGAKVQRAMHEDEVGELRYQASMAGMKLSMLKPGEGDRNVALMLGGYMLGSVFGPAGSKLGPSLKPLRRVYNFFRPEGLKYTGRAFVNGLIKIPRFGYAMFNGVRGFIGLTGRNGDNLSLRFLAEDLWSLFGVGSKKVGKRLEEATAIILDETKSVLQTNMEMVLGPEKGALINRMVDELVKDTALAPKKLNGLKRALRKVFEGKLDAKGLEKQILNLLGADAQDIAGPFAEAVFRENGMLQAEELYRFLSTGAGDSEAFITRLVNVFKTENTEATIRQWVRLVGPTDARHLLKLLALVRDEGTMSLQMERLLKNLVRNEESAAKLLEIFLTGPTREEIASAGYKVGKAFDKHVLGDLITREERAALYDVIDNCLQAKTKLERSKILTEQFFDDFRKIKGADEFLKRVMGDEAIDYSSREGRGRVIEIIASRRDTGKEFMELALGKGLPKQEALLFPIAAKKTLLSALVNPSQRLDVGKEFQHVLKDILRPRLQEWIDTPLYKIADVNVRADRRVSARYLSQAIVISDDAGEDFAKGIVKNMSPQDIEANMVVDGEDYFERALSGLRKDTQNNLIAQIKKSMNYKPDKGIFDFVARPFNSLYNRLGPRWLDKQWSTRIGIAARTILSNDPGMGYTHNPRLWRTMLLRQAYLARTATEEGGKNAAKEVARIWRFLGDANEFMSKRIFTNEMTGLYRVCVPIAGADLLMSGGSVSNMENLGTICLLISGDYAMQRVGLSTANAMHIVTVNRALGMSWIKLDDDSDELFDSKRFVGTWWESGMGIFLQSAMMYGPTFYEKIPLANIFGQMPIIGGAIDAISMTGPKFFSFYRGSLNKPELLWGAGTAGFVKGLGFNTAMGMGQSMAVSTVTKGPWFVDTSSDYVWSNVLRYGINGVVCNAPGATLNRILEKDTPDADLRSTMRQLYERTMGVVTQYIAAQPFDIFAGKAESEGKFNRFLGEAAAGKSESRRQAWNVFARRYAYDVLMQMPEDEDRQFRLHHGPTFKLLQLKTWFSESWEDAKKQVHQGTFVKLARERPELLEQLLTEVELQMLNEGAVWRNRSGSIEGEANSKALHYFSLMANYYAYKARNGEHEYDPFLRFIERSRFQEYWKMLPVLATEEDLEGEIIFVEDNDLVHTADMQRLNLPELQFGYLKLSK